MRRWTWLVVVALTVAAAGVADAHPGGLNAQGCHMNRKTGEYHCHRAQAPADSPQRAVPAGSSSGPAVKMSRSGICHDRNSPWYSQTLHYTSFASMEACKEAGGRPPKGR
jgi:hypothetical protein